MIFSEGLGQGLRAPWTGGAAAGCGDQTGHFARRGGAGPSCKEGTALVDGVRPTEHVSAQPSNPRPQVWVVVALLLGIVVAPLLGSRSWCEMPMGHHFFDWPREMAE